ncbi:type II toxin-antitoxin system RelE/ParE family toxin [Castellaniella sp. MT123]|uniref:type II toxin-antitoxin system RelE/ParE family toxin n=1 Tax=Castellaniella sp. MT123 TaxID=3140381 RepID=UPI0031F47591
MVATNFAGCWFFLYGFEKSNSADIAIDELKALRQVAEELLELDDYSLLVALRAGKIIEVSNGYDQTEKPHPG